MEEYRECLVCSTPITSYHLGMDICRACASFFKRAKMSGLDYPCRQGNQKCTVIKESKFMCRRCRFDKCLSVGIIYNGPMRLRAKPVTPLMEIIETEFNTLVDRRRAKELEYLGKCPSSGMIPHPKEKIYFVSGKSSIEIYTIALTESWTFFENAFVALKKLPQHEKETIFKDYVPKLCLILSYYLTRKLWGDARKKLMCSVTTCFDTEVPFDFYYPQDNGNKDFFKSSIDSYSDDHANVFVPQFDRAKLHEKEFYALVALALTEHDLQISEEAYQLLDSIRYEIYENLQTYYQNELGLVDFSVRLGNLMSLNHIVQECMSLYKTFFRFFATFFDMYMTDKLLERMSL
ncbi:hypothetical protein PRIPAC_78283 [Pristionchus pacificus]|nr:hypothetical protein PRIPAC_78283 [Pristionchus pacificus]